MVFTKLKKQIADLKSSLVDANCEINLLKERLGKLEEMYKADKELSEEEKKRIEKENEERFEENQVFNDWSKSVR